LIDEILADIADLADLAAEGADGVTAEGDEAAGGEDHAGGGLGDEEGVEGAHGLHGAPHGFGRVGFLFADGGEEMDTEEAAEHGEAEEEMVIADGLAEEGAEVIGDDMEEEAAEDGADGGEGAGEGEEDGDVGGAIGWGQLQHETELAELETGGGATGDEVGEGEMPPPARTGHGPGQETDDGPQHGGDVEDGFDAESVAEKAPTGQGDEAAEPGEGGEPADVADGSLGDLQEEHGVERL